MDAELVRAQRAADEWERRPECRGQGFGADIGPRLLREAVDICTELEATHPDKANAVRLMKTIERKWNERAIRAEEHGNPEPAETVYLLQSVMTFLEVATSETKKRAKRLLFLTYPELASLPASSRKL